MAETPAPALFGVQRVVVECEFDSSLSNDERRTLCEQLVGKARQFTDLPVTEAKAADLNPLSGQVHKHELVLQVRARAHNIASGRKGLEVSVTPVRPMVAVGTLATLTSTASLVRVQDDWVVQGPIDAFQKLLGSTGGRRMRAPLTADNK